MGGCAEAPEAAPTAEERYEAWHADYSGRSREEDRREFVKQIRSAESSAYSRGAERAEELRAVCIEADRKLAEFVSRGTAAIHKAREILRARMNPHA